MMRRSRLFACNLMDCSSSLCSSSSDGGGDGCCNGAQTNETYLENAKALVERFSIVLDVACLSEGIRALGGLLNISLAQQNRLSKAHEQVPSRDRIGHDDVYEYLLDKNRLDIELYEWSKSRALINCTKIQEANNEPLL